MPADGREHVDLDLEDFGVIRVFNHKHSVVGEQGLEKSARHTSLVLYVQPNRLDAGKYAQFLQLEESSEGQTVSCKVLRLRSHN